MRNIIALCALVLLSACSTTGMYDAPDADNAAVIKIENFINAGSQDQSQKGWVMPGANTATKVGLFTIDGDRLDETGGDQQVTVAPGKHSVQIFADGGGALRFKKFSLKVSAGSEYVVRINKSGSADSNYIAHVIDAAEPDQIIKEVAF